MTETNRSVPRVRSYRRGQIVERRRPRRHDGRILSVGTKAEILERAGGPKAFYRVRLEDGSVDVWFAPCFRTTPRPVTAAVV